jgi:ParB/RepB/Spo0J family partition protein
VSRDTLLSLIDPDPEQPRKLFNDASLQELAQSMATNGLVVPILLRPSPGERYIIVHGERCYRAAMALGWETIPAEVRELTPDEAHWTSLVENVQRADLLPIEEARAYQHRLGQGLTQDQLAQRVGKNRSYIAQKLRLLTLPAPIVVYLEGKALTEGHARQLLKIRQWYGCELTREFPGLRETLATKDWEAETSKHVCLLLCGLRPEKEPDYLPVFLYPRSTAAESSTFAAYRAFCEDLQLRDPAVPQWEVVAFWWAAAVVLGELSVSALDRALERWHRRILSALTYWDLRWRTTGHCNAPQWASERAEAMWYWSCWGDLRHAGLLTAAIRREVPTNLQKDANEWVYREGAFVYPSQLQRRYAESSEEMTALFGG